MTKISADLHAIYEPGKPVEQQLHALESYQTLMDPFTGKPYHYSQEKRLLYSLGPDQDDDQGKEKFQITKDSDISIPLTLNKKTTIKDPPEG
jgi:hypothetical protein